MITEALSPAAASATAAAISAGCAAATSIAAWMTIRGRRPKLNVRTEVGDPDGGVLILSPDGIAIAVRVANVRDADVQVLDLWFETPGRRFRKLRRLEEPWRVTPLEEAFVEGAGEIPGTVKAHHTELYGFRTAEVGMELLEAGHPLYRPVIECAGDRVFRGDWFRVHASDPESLPEEG